MVGPSVPHKKTHTVVPQTHQTRAPPAPGSIVCKTDGPPSAVTPPAESRWALVVADLLFCPLPYAECTNLACESCHQFLHRNQDFHHRLLGLISELLPLVLFKFPRPECNRARCAAKNMSRACRYRTPSLLSGTPSILAGRTTTSCPAVPRTQNIQFSGGENCVACFHTLSTSSRSVQTVMCFRDSSFSHHQDGAEQCRARRGVLCP